MILKGPYLHESSFHVKELGVTLHTIYHKEHKGPIFWIENDDPENAFVISFKTPPTSDNGLTHILEHLVLCGSMRYPVKDPFFAMTRRSLATFMNAMTGDDFTCYPAATQNRSDFYNLLSIYLDALFFPKLDPYYFEQEGWRICPINPDDPKSPLAFRGVVFNEMKQHLARPMTLLFSEMDHLLFEGSPYAFESGGKPHVIPTLSYEELVSYHQTHYTCSNAIFYFYGNIPIQDHLDFLDKELMGRIKIDKAPAISIHIPPLKADKTIHHSTYGCDENSAPHYLMVSFKTASIDDFASRLALQLLDELWMGHDGSPLKALLCESDAFVDVDSVIDLERKTGTYSLIFQNIDPARQNEVVELLEKSLWHLLSSPFDPQLVERALFQLKFEILEIDPQSYPYGIELFFRLLPVQHGADAKAQLDLAYHLKQVSEKALNPLFWKELVERFFIFNQEKRLLLLSPDPDKNSSLEKLIQQELQKASGCYQVHCAPHDENMAQSLPCLQLQDLSPTPPSFHIPWQKEGFFFHHRATNEITYAQYAINIPHLHQEKLSYLSLFKALWAEIGTEKESYLERLENLDAHLGQMEIKYHAPLHEQPSKGACHFVSLFASSTTDRAHMIPSLLEEQLFECDLQDSKRIDQLIDQLATSLKRRFISRPLEYALNETLSMLSPYSYDRLYLSGLPFLHFIEKINSSPSPMQSALEGLNEIHHMLTQSKAGDLLITQASPLSLPFRKLSSTPLPLIYHPSHTTSFPRHILRKSSSPVSSNVLAIATIDRSHPDYIALYLAAELATEWILHPLIREKGGAYGARASYRAEEGIMMLYSHADPHLIETAEIFQKSAALLLERPISDEELLEAKISLFQKLDKPLPPKEHASCGYLLYRKGTTDEKRMKERLAIIECSKEKIKMAIEHHWQSSISKSLFVSYAPEEKIKTDSSKLQRLFQEDLIVCDLLESSQNPNMI